MHRISDAGRAWVARHHGLEGYFKILRRGYGTPEAAPTPEIETVPVGAAHDV
jgi:hypothetical protein